MPDKDVNTGRFVGIASPEGFKWCWRHQAHEPVSEFGPDKSRSDGLRPDCRLGAREVSKERNSKQPGYVARPYKKASGPAPEGMKWCNNHEAFCLKEDFTGDSRKADGLQGSCRRAFMERTRKKDGSVPQHASKYNPDPPGTKWCSWHQTHEMLAKFGNKAPSKRDPSEKQGMCRAGQAEYTVEHAAEFSARCQTRRARRIGNGGEHTAEDIADIRRMQGDNCAICTKPLKGGGVKDHIKPLKLGGDNGRRNIQLLHRKCNGEKAAKDPLDHARSLGRLL